MSDLKALRQAASFTVGEVAPIEPEPQTPEHQLIEGDAWNRYLDAPDIAADCLLNEQGDGLLYRGLLNVIYGKGGTGKSWLALEAARQEIMAGRSVLLLDMENPLKRLAKRMQTLGVPRSMLTAHAVSIDYGSFITKATWQEIIARPWSLVVVDSFQAALNALTSGADSNSADHIEQFMSGRLGALVATGACVVVIDHPNKAGTNGAAGSSRKFNYVQGVSYRAESCMTLAPGALGSFRLIKDKDNEGAITKRLSEGREYGNPEQEAAFIEVDSRDDVSNPASTMIRVRAPRTTSDKHSERLAKLADLIVEALTAADDHQLSTIVEVQRVIRDAGEAVRRELVLDLITYGQQQGLWNVTRKGTHARAATVLSLPDVNPAAS